MKRFLRSLFIFFLIPIVLIIVFFIMVNSKLKEFRLNTNVTEIYAGDSHVQYAIDDNILVNSKNLGISSESYYFTYYKLNMILKSNQNIRTVYLGFSYHNLSEYYDDFVYGKYSESVSPNYFYILPFEEQIKIIKCNRNHLPSYLMGIIKVGITILLNKFPFAGGYQSNFANVTAVKSSMDKRLKFQFYTNSKLNKLSSFNISNLNKIIKLCQDFNISLVLINTPLNPYYKSKLPIEYIDMYNKLLNSTKLAVIDLNNIYLPDSCFIPDGDHLSKEGAFKISNELKNGLCDSCLHAPIPATF